MKKTTDKISYRPSKALEKTLKEANRDIKLRKNLSPIFTCMEEMDIYLRRL